MPVVISTMGMLADSAILASANLAVILVTGLMRLTHVGCCSLGQPASILVLVVSPVLLLFTLGYSVRDLVRRRTRLQAVIALVLSVPSVMLLLSIRF